ncbi:MAG: sulfite exporter TauE/SafE family protein [Candidatus Eisenbacteria bacterium]
MSHQVTLLAVSAASIGFFHTLLGPDHYLPFIMMGRARKWSRAKIFWVTAVCGIGHVGSSVVLGMVGIALGIGITRLEIFESFRGNLAAWVLIAFGLVYFVWGLRRALRNKPHEHKHLHDGGLNHTHTHVHTEDHTHVHDKPSASITPWVLFTIFVLGPCEPLIPLLMYPAAKTSLAGVILVAAVFAVATIGTMLGVVLLSSYGVSLLPMARVERYTHAIAGATIMVCGAAIQFLGL